MDDQEAIFATLERLGLPYRLLEHAPVRGMEDCARIAEPLGAVYPKNLFLAPRSGRSQYLLLLRPFVRFDASKVSKQAGSPRLQFAGDDALFSLLRAQPGAITPLGLCLPGAGPVRLLVDKGLDGARRLCFHPLVPNRTVVLDARDFFDRFLPAVGCQPLWLEP